MPTLRAPYRRAAANSRLEQRLDDDALEARAEVGQFLRARRASPSPCARTCRSTAVLSPLKLKSQLARQSAARCDRRCVMRVVGKAHGAVVALRASRSMTGPPGIPEPEQLRHLVVRLARRIVARPADQPVVARRAARGRGWCGRRTRRGRPPAAAAAPFCEEQRLDVAGEVMHRHERQVRTTPASDFANDRPTSSDPTRPGPCVTAIGVEVAPASTAASPSARSTTPQMSRTCWRDASSGTTPPHSRWISTCEATTLERIDPRPRRRRRSPRRPRRPSRRTRSRCPG